MFGTVDRVPLTGRDPRVDVSRDMMRAWSSFCHDGDPGWAEVEGRTEVHVLGAATAVAADQDVTGSVRAARVG